MSNSEILKQIQELNLVIGNALREVEKGHNIDFYRALLQQNSINIYQQAAKLDSKTQSAEAPVLTTPEAKAIPIEQPVKTEEPVVREEKKTEPAAQQVRHEPLSPPVEPAVTKKPEPVPPHQQSKSKPVEIEEEDVSLNAKLSKNKQPVLNISEKSKEMPIKDLVKAISIGKKFEFINDLFDGNSDAYKSCIQSIQQFSSYEEASSFLETHIIGPYNWSDNDMLAAEFFSLVKRRFL